MKPPPPRLPARGKVTASAKPTATAASTALPPRFKMSNPTREAAASCVTTMPCLAIDRTRGGEGGDESRIGDGCGWSEKDKASAAN